MFVVGVALSLRGLPFDWYAQFRLEERFGFNTTTPTTWWMDRFKGLLLALTLGYPLLTLVLKLVEWMGDRWWLWAWACVLGFQLLMVVLGPILILPLFSNLTPHPLYSGFYYSHPTPLEREQALALWPRVGPHAARRRPKIT